MGLDLKSLQMGFLVFFWGWVALSQGSGASGPCVRIGTCSILEMAKHSMTDSNIMEELADVATKNQGGKSAIKGIKGLKVKDIRPPNITLCYIKDVGMGMSVGSQITIAGKSFIGGTMEITVVSNMTTISRMTVVKGNMNFEVIECKVELISCKTNLPSSMLPKIVNKFLNSTLGKVLPGMMCPAADKVVGEMKKKMGNLWEPQSIGSVGTIKYSPSGTPKITTNHARLCFETRITRTSGEEIEMATESQASDVLPDEESVNSELLVSVEIMNGPMEFYKDTMNKDVTSDTVEAEFTLIIDVLREKVPTLDLPETYSDLKFKIRCTSAPKWSLGEGVAALTAAFTIELVAGAQEESVFLLSTDLEISATFEVMDGVLHPSLGESRLENLLVISAAVSFDPESLRSHLLDLLRVTIIPALKTAVDDGIPLPSMMGSGYGIATIEIHPNILRVIVSCN